MAIPMRLNPTNRNMFQPLEPGADKVSKSIKDSLLRGAGGIFKRGEVLMFIVTFVIYWTCELSV